MNTTTTGNRSAWLERALATVTEVVFPPVCAGCGRLGTILCERCLAGLSPVPEPICRRCGRVLDGEENGGTQHQCAACTKEPQTLIQARAPLLYIEPASQLIHRMKYDGYFALAAPLAGIMTANWPAWQQAPDLIQPIPLHARRKRQRGYNQSALLAKRMARDQGIEFDEKGLQRIRHTQPQIHLNPEERRSNVSGAFDADPARVAGRHVLLIDDVYTTGATMASAAEALLAAGARSVSGYCLARVS